MSIEPEVRWFAPRDASWYNHPDTRTAKVVHADTGEAFALCNSRVLLDETLRMRAGEVGTQVRCRRRSCARAFEEAGSYPRRFDT